VQSTLQNVKHEPSRGYGGMHPRKFLKNACSLVFSDAQNFYAKDRLWKFTVREISLAVHTTFVFLKLSSYLEVLTSLKYAPGY